MNVKIRRFEVELLEATNIIHNLMVKSGFHETGTILCVKGKFC
jgi:hypothetical protein